MSEIARRFLWSGALLGACAALCACSSFDQVSNQVAGVITPYKVEVVQGNFLSREQVQALQTGMSRQQVRDVLGTPLLASIFHTDRWEYVFTLKRQGFDPQQRKLTVYFKGDQLERFEGDEMPTEAEFVASLGSRRQLTAVPVLEVPPESLKQAGGTGAAPAPKPAEPAPAPARTTPYPPLEAAQR